MKNLHLLPTTDKPSRLCKISYYGDIGDRETKFMIAPNYDAFIYQKDKGVIIQPFNIYITNSEKIKEGDWAINLKSDEVYQIFILNEVVNYEKKVILTTDPALIADGVQAIDDTFLQWFINNPSCEEVEVIYGLFNTMGRQVDPMNLGQNHSQCVWKYKIIISTEEPKQETLEATITMKNKIDTTKKYTTRDRREARIYATDGAGSYPLHGAVKQENGEWHTVEWTEDGYYLADETEEARDLVEAVEQKMLKGWVNIYDHSPTKGFLHLTKELADSVVPSSKRIACVYVEIPYKEGEGLQVSLD